MVSFFPVTKSPAYSPSVISLRVAVRLCPTRRLSVPGLLQRSLDGFSYVGLGSVLQAVLATSTSRIFLDPISLSNEKPSDFPRSRALVSPTFITHPLSRIEHLPLLFICKLYTLLFN